MGTLSDLFDIVKIAKHVAPNKQNEINDAILVSKLLGKTRSISSMASKYTLEYPVLISANISDYQTVLNLTKQIELECATFIILSSGLKPVVNIGAGETIDRHITSLMVSAESKNRFELTEPTFDQKISAEQYMNEYYNTPYTIAGSEKSLEATIPLDQDDTGGDDLATVVTTDMKDDDKKDKDDDKKPLVDVRSKKLIVPMVPDKNGKLQSSLKETYIGGADIHNLTNTLGKLSKVPPTVINLKLILADTQGSQNEIDVPLAVKATLNYITNEEMISLTDNIIESGKSLLKFVKLTSGQISFFKDFIFEMEKVKRDKELEMKLGRYPWFRRLIDNKNKNKLKRVLNVIDPLKAFVAKGELMPTGTLIMTVDEITSATSMNFNYLLNNKRHIEKIIDTLMLLCVGIVDEYNEMVYFYFSGVSEPTIYKLSDIGSQKAGKDSNSKLLANLSELLVKRG